MKEIVEKAPKMPGDVQWHFIGHLQSNKCKPLLHSESLYGIIYAFYVYIIVYTRCHAIYVSSYYVVYIVPNLWVVESVDTVKLADKLNEECTKIGNILT